MTPPYGKMNATDLLETYFIENRARLLDISSFLDRIERYPGAEAAKKDFRYLAFLHALDLLRESGPDRTAAIQRSFSDPTTEPIESAVGLRAHGAWPGGKP